MTGPNKPPKKTAIILDDNDQERFILTRYLEKLGFDVIGFADLYVAVHFSQMLIANHDVFFLDLILSPFESGLYILSQRQTKFAWLKDIKIIVLSSLGDTATIMKAMELGADGYVIKPYSETMIKQKLIEVGVL